MNQVYDLLNKPLLITLSMSFAEQVLGRHKPVGSFDKFFYPNQCLESSRS